MLIIPPIQHRRRRKRSRNPVPPSPGPILTAATYDNVGLINMQRYQATGTIYQPGPTQIRIGLNVFEASTIEATVLIASAGNGIVAQSDGGPWAGASVDLPF